MPIFINLDFFVLAGEIFLITPLADINKIIIDKNAGSGVVPYLPLQELKAGTN